MVEKTIDAKAKTGLQPSSYIWDMDQHCLWDNCLAYITTAKYQACATWDPWDEQPKKILDQDSKCSHFLYLKNGKASDKKAKKKKKKK